RPATPHWLLPHPPGWVRPAGAQVAPLRLQLPHRHQGERRLKNACRTARAAYTAPRGSGASLSGGRQGAPDEVRMLSFVQKLFDNNEREVKRFENEVVARVNSLEPEVEKLEDLVAAYAELRRRHQEGGESLDALMAEAFALTRESAKRYLGQRHYDVQLIGGSALHAGRIAEMKTGEGKTLVATLALALNALTGKGTHLVTTNDYLARTGAEWMGPVYRGLGLT